MPELSEGLLMLFVEGGISLVLLSVLIYQLHYLNRLIEKLIDRLTDE